MMKIGINLIPTAISVAEAVETIKVAEEIGYEICLVADEGFMPDVYVTLGAAARETSRIKLGPVTNGYTRHPAVTAVALATLNEISEGRALANLVAGGSVVLGPMNIPLETPLTVVRESIEIMHRLWSGESVTWEGKRFSLNKAKMSLPKQDIPIWIAARGPKMLALSGEIGDGVVLMGKSDLEPALEIVTKAEEAAGKLKTERVFLDSIVYTPQMMEKTTEFFGHVIMDMPERQQLSFLSRDELAAMKAAFVKGGASAVTDLLTPEIIKRYKVAGTVEECVQTVQNLGREYQLDAFILLVTGANLEENRRVMQETYDILLAARDGLGEN